MSPAKMFVPIPIKTEAKVMLAKTKHDILDLYDVT